MNKVLMSGNRVHIVGRRRIAIVVTIQKQFTIQWDMQEYGSSHRRKTQEEGDQTIRCIWCKHTPNIYTKQRPNKIRHSNRRGSKASLEAAAF
jgi:hypothetical protein